MIKRNSILNSSDFGPDLGDFAEIYFNAHNNNYVSIQVLLGNIATCFLPETKN